MTSEGIKGRDDDLIWRTIQAFSYGVQAKKNENP